MNKQQAIQQAEDLKKILGEGWIINTFELSKNVWFLRADNFPFSIIPYVRGGETRYQVFIERPFDECCGGNPKDTIKLLAENARKKLNDLKNIVEKAEKIVENLPE